MRAFSRLTLCCSAAIVALAATAALADQQIGSVVQRDFNGATGLRVASAAADDLIFERDVFAGETVKTPSSASTVIRFADKTQIQVGANSTIVLDKFVYDPSSGTGDAAIKFGTGVFRFITGDIKNKDAVKLSTPTTSLTIRGTKFILAVAADGSTTLGVLEGAVDVAPCGGAQSVRENTGQAVQVLRAARATPSIWAACPPISPLPATMMSARTMPAKHRGPEPGPGLVRARPPAIPGIRVPPTAVAAGAVLSVAVGAAVVVPAEGAVDSAAAAATPTTESWRLS
jgi:hypothetical protein